MNKSEDVSKLFAMFGEKNTDQYQEIYDAEQNQAARERWPVFERVQVDAARAATRPAAPIAPPPKPVVEKSAAPTTPAPVEAPVQAPATPVVEAPPVVTAPTDTPRPTAATPVTPNPAPRKNSFLKFPAARTPVATGEVATPAEPSVAPAPAPAPAPTGQLNQLFARLSGATSPQEPAVHAAPTTEPSPEPTTSPIRSLFNRLSR